MKGIFSVAILATFFIGLNIFISVQDAKAELACSAKKPGINEYFSYRDGSCIKISANNS